MISEKQFIIKYKIPSAPLRRELQVNATSRYQALKKFKEGKMTEFPKGCTIISCDDLECDQTRMEM